MQWKYLLGSAVIAVGMAMTPVPTFADTIESVEGARAKERQGRWLNRQDREQLRRWGGNDDYRYYRAQPYDDGYYYGRGPGVRLYVDPY